MIATDALLDAALAYAARGWPVLPLHTVKARRCSCGKAGCKSPAKHPWAPHGLKAATTDPAVIRRWWKRWPSANIGLRTDGLAVVDVDPAHGGEKSLAALVANHGPLPRTPTAATGGGGLHLLFRQNGRAVRNSAGRLGPGLDVRGDGGYIVAPPSLHVSGRRYAWTVSPADCEPPPLPAVIEELLIGPRVAATLADRGRAYADAAAGVPEGQRNAAAFRLAGHLAALRGEAGEGLSESQVLDLCREWNASNAPPLDDAELAQAVHSALTSGTPRADKPARPAASFAADADDDDAPNPMAPAGARKLLAKLGLNVTRVLRIGQPATYDIELADSTRFSLGDAGALLMPTRVQAAVAEATGIVIPGRSRAKWRPFAQGLLTLAEPVAADETEEEGLREMLRRYLEQCTISDIDSFAVGEQTEHLARALTRRDPFWRHSRFHVSASALLRFIGFVEGRRITDRDLRDRLARAGFTSQKIAARTGDGVAQARYWVSAEDFEP